MPKYQFLTDEWITEAKRIRESIEGDLPAPAHQVRMNLVITEVPFGDGDIHAHMDTSDGEMKTDLGHVDDPEVSLSVDYATAKAIFVDGDPQAGMQAFMAGKVKLLGGDISKLMALAGSVAPDPKAAEVATAIKEMTAD